MVSAPWDTGVSPFKFPLDSHPGDLAQFRDQRTTSTGQRKMQPLSGAAFKSAVINFLGGLSKYFCNCFCFS